MKRELVIDDIRVTLESRAVSCLVGNVWKHGRISGFLDEDGNETFDPSETEIIIVQWNDDQCWSPIQCRFERSEATVH